MKFINSSKELGIEFKRLLDRYNNYQFMTAWAGAEFEFSKLLFERRHKIKKFIIGLHFYQTHPSFITKFYQLNAVKFIKLTSGIFHPKVYLFYDDEFNWELLVGSGNFTNAAFFSNTESFIIVTSTESKDEAFNKVLNSINISWGKASKFTSDELLKYSKLFERKQQDRDFFAGSGMIESGRSLYTLPIVNMTWRQFIDRIIIHDQDIDTRIALLDTVRSHFITSPSLSNMEINWRRQIGGYVSANEAINFRLFGNMQNARKFKHILNTNPTLISAALDNIPLVGKVSKNQFESYARMFSAATDGGNKYKSALRLLTMKRPDIFFGLTSANNHRVGRDFGITNINDMDLSRYWDEIITPIHESEWWQRPSPLNTREAKIAEYRAAFLDTVYYNQNQ